MKPLLSTKFRKEIQNASNGNYTFMVKNIKVNGVNRGCSGHIKNNDTGTCVYVNTERSCASWLKNYMYRYADSEKDFSSLRYRNRFADTIEELVREVIALLQVRPEDAKDIR